MSEDPRPAGELARGDRLDRYEIVSPLAVGGMGEVYRARDLRLQREVAIKVLPASLSTDPERLGRFEQEARATGALDHPNVLVVHDVGTHGGAPYLPTSGSRRTSGIPPFLGTERRCTGSPSTSGPSSGSRSRGEGG